MERGQASELRPQDRDEEQEEITRILSHPFRFYRYLLKLIYGHLVVLTLFFILYWVLSTAPKAYCFSHIE